MNSLVKTIALTADSNKLNKLLGIIPELPGCYLMKDNNDNYLYIGKSKNLRSRVRSYFRNNSELSPRISLMVRQIYDIEFILTDTEVEALTLESNLIKQNQPYFNVLLKDDKKYPYVCITWSEKYPRIFITRRRRNRNIKDRYYGPYVDVSSLRNTINLLKKIFPVRQRIRPLYKDKTCLNYSIGRCPGVCQEVIDSSKYRLTINKIAMVFEGRTDDLISELNKSMLKYSEVMEYEKALKIKNQIKAIFSLTQSQKMIDPDSSINRDVIAFASNKTFTCVQLFQMRSGKLIARIGYTADTKNNCSDIILQKVMEEHYSNLTAVEIPGEIVIEQKLNKSFIFNEWLNELRGRKVRLVYPKKSHKNKLVKLVKMNAEFELNSICHGIEKHKLALEDLSNLLELEGVPKRIEGYDISHIQGSNAVGSQVVFINGIPAKHHYRKYKIKNESIHIGHSDDYLAIEEIITRRFNCFSRYKEKGIDLSHIRKHKSSIFDPSLINDFPDLILIDGGKGQLNAALKALKKLGLEGDVRLCSLAKKREEIFVPGIGDSLEYLKDDEGVLLLRRLRDEAHRFAISFHRDRRSKNLKRSILTEIPGIGPKRIKVLLRHFKSINALQLASQEEIAEIQGVGNEIALNIWNYFNKE